LLLLLPQERNYKKKERKKEHSEREKHRKKDSKKARKNEGNGVELLVRYSLKVNIQWRLATV
jgi:hypothetical protein